MIAFILTIRKPKTPILSHCSVKDFHGDLKFSVCFRDAEVKCGTITHVMLTFTFLKNFR